MSMGHKEWLESVLERLPTLRPPVSSLIKPSTPVLEVQAKLMGALWACPLFSTICPYDLLQPHAEGRPNTLTVDRWHKNGGFAGYSLGDVPGLASERKAWRAGPLVVYVRHPLFERDALKHFAAGAKYALRVVPCAPATADYEMLAYLLYMLKERPWYADLTRMALDLGVVQYLPWVLDFCGYVSKPAHGSEARYVHASPWVEPSRLDATPAWPGTFPLVHVISVKAALRRAAVDPHKERKVHYYNSWARCLSKDPTITDSDYLMSRLPTMKNDDVRKLIIDSLNWRSTVLEMQKQSEKTCSSLLDAPIIRVTDEGEKPDG